MRILIACLVFLTFLFFCNCSKKIELKKPDTTLKVKPTFRGRYFTDNDKDRSTFFLFDVKLINHTDSIISFWTFSSAPGINVLIDNDQLSFLIPEISRNVPRIIWLEPNQEFLVPVVIYKNGYKRINSMIRFGFIVYKPIYKSGLKKTLDFDHDPMIELEEMRIKKENIIWSDPIDIFGSNEFLYEIRTDIDDSTFKVLPKSRLYEFKF
jgi:hypothetical protein